MIGHVRNDDGSARVKPGAQRIIRGVPLVGVRGTRMLISEEASITGFRHYPKAALVIRHSVTTNARTRRQLILLEVQVEAGAEASHLSGTTSRSANRGSGNDSADEPGRYRVKQTKGNRDDK